MSGDSDALGGVVCQLITFPMIMASNDNEMVTFAARSMGGELTYGFRDGGSLRWFFFS